MRALLLALMLSTPAAAAPTASDPSDPSTYVQLLSTPCASADLRRDLAADGAESPPMRAVLVVKGERTEACWAAHSTPVAHVDVESAEFSVSVPIEQFTDEPLRQAPAPGKTKRI
jgi:hypothetical protein